MEVSLGSLSLSIDHVAFAGADIVQARSAIRVLLSDGYLDVIEFADPRETAEQTQVSVLTPTGVILRCDDLAKTHRLLIESGVCCAPPYSIDRVFGAETPDQHYEIFSTTERHGCGLPLAVIRTQPSAPMANESDHTAEVGCISDAASCPLYADP